MFFVIIEANRNLGYGRNRDSYKKLKADENENN